MNASLSGPLFSLRRAGGYRSNTPTKRHRISRVQADLGRLVDRLNRRLYPESIPVLASFWLKTVYWNGYTREEWRELDKLLRKYCQNTPGLSEPALQAVTDIRNWIKDSSREPRKEQASGTLASQARRPALNSAALVAYAVRLLNEWLPQEVARILIREPEPGVPALTIGRALERLLLRDRLSLSTLEALLNPDLLSARLAYPADVEILHDVVLYLLGRTEATPSAVLPPILLAITSDSRLSPDYAADVAKGTIVAGSGREELHIPVTAGRVAHIMEDPFARIGSVLVTADGRCWEVDRLEESGRNVIVYRPHSRLRFDYSHDHLRLKLPWPDGRRSWPGEISFPQSVEIFGRLWRVASWERDAVRTWLNLVFAGPLPASAAVPPGVVPFRRSSPASADLAWAELGTALAASAARRDWDPMEHLQREDLIPLGRALFGLSQTLADRRQTPAAIGEHLNRICFLHSGVQSTYGLIPWRVLPPDARKTLLSKARGDGALRDNLSRIFLDVPSVSEGVHSLRSLVKLATHSGIGTPFDTYKSA